MTESILAAVYAARDWARAHHLEIKTLELVVPVTAHPAFDKAAHYFGIRLVRIPQKARREAARFDHSEYRGKSVGFEARWRESRHPTIGKDQV